MRSGNSMFRRFSLFMSAVIVITSLLSGCNHEPLEPFYVDFSFPHGAPSLNHEAEILCIAKSTADLNNVHIWVVLPEGLKLISGVLDWNGNVTKDKECLTVQAIVKSVKTGRYEIIVHEAFPEEQLPGFIVQPDGYSVYISIGENKSEWGVTKPWEGSTSPLPINVITSTISPSP